MIRLRHLTIFLSTALILFAIIPAPEAQAGVFDRIKDIYNTPEKINELQQQYIDATQQLENTIEEQKQQLDDAMNAASILAEKQQELLAQNEQIQQLNAEYMQQNQQLAEQNAALLSELEQAKQQRKSLMDKLVNTIIAAIVIIAAYFVALRIWRYMNWRRHGQSAGRGLS